MRKSIRFALIAAALAGSFATSAEADAACCRRADRRPVLGAPVRIGQRIAERRIVRRAMTAPFRAIRGCCQ